MTHDDRMLLIGPGIGKAGTWADLGCGDGAFTEALAELAGPEVRLHAVDRDAQALGALTERLRARWPKIRLDTHFADLHALPKLPALDGVLIANALHYFEHPEAVLEQARQRLVMSGKLLVVEYDTDWANPWVPHPRSFRTWEKLSAASGFSKPRLLGHVNSTYNERMYAAVSQRVR